ncbi:MAG: hypothetical protein IK092_06710, partial [Muribaculaceae bacterium]|nr:hypothetical protein [Muribaculaceae bacterium]
ASSAVKEVSVDLPSSLKGKVEVTKVSRAYSGSYGYVTIDVTFKLLKKVNTAPFLSSYGQMWIVGDVRDASGAVVKGLMPNYNEWRTDDSDGSEFKQFLEVIQAKRFQ